MTGAQSPRATEGWAVEAYGAAETLALGQRPLAAPGRGELVVAVEAMSLNPLDLKIISGRMKDIMPAAMPYVPGSDLVGRVAAAGDAAPAAVGDRVAISTWNGAAARHALVPASAHVASVADEAPAAEVAALPMAGLTALHILRMIGEVQGRTVAIAGATGGVGLMLAQLARAAGARVIGSAHDAEDARLLAANGVQETVGYAQRPFVEGLRERHPDGVDVLVDFVAMFDALLASAGAVRDGGLLLSTLFGPEPAMFGDRIGMRYVRLAAQPGDLDQIVGGHAQGVLRANVTGTFPFAQGREAYLALRDDHVRGKIVLQVTDAG